MFLKRASTSHYDSNVFRQITCGTQKLYGYKSTMQPEKTCYMLKQRSITSQPTHMCDRIFSLLVALCLLASITDLFLRLRYQGIDILVILHTIPSTISWWWSELTEDWIHPKSAVFMMAAVIFSSTECV